MIDDNYILMDLHHKVTNIERDLVELKRIIKNIRPYAESEAEKPMTRAEFAAAAGITFPTVREWEKKGFIKPFRIGSRVYFRRSELTRAS